MKFWHRYVWLVLYLPSLILAALAARIPAGLGTGTHNYDQIMAFRSSCILWGLFYVLVALLLRVGWHFYGDRSHKSPEQRRGFEVLFNESK